jgi:hypothetical protein
MNGPELLRRVCFGHLMIVGEVRAADVREAGLVDTKTGLKSTVWLITYFVELMREGGFDVAKIIRRVPVESPDSSTAPIGAEKGKCYAFEIESCERKHGFLVARMSPTMPALIGEQGAALPGDAPSGAAMGSAASNLVYLQTTPRTP